MVFYAHPVPLLSRQLRPERLLLATHRHRGDDLFGKGPGGLLHFSLPPLSSFPWVDTRGRDLRESIRRQIDKKSGGPQGERSGVLEEQIG